MDYHLLREFADSWVLLGLTLFFIGVIVWVLRPGGTSEYNDSADIPFRHKNKPADDDDGNVSHTKEART